MHLFFPHLQLPPLPVDQEAFFNAVFNNPESQQMFSGMNEAFAGLMSGFEQMAQDPELKNDMDQIMQNMMGAGTVATESTLHVVCKSIDEQNHAYMCRIR